MVLVNKMKLVKWNKKKKKKKKKKMELADFVWEIKRVENYPDFEKLAHVIQHGPDRSLSV